MTPSIVDFIEARLADDEAAAKEAGRRSETWIANGTWHLEGVEHDAIGQEDAFCHPYNRDHIARHDPARVLREVEAKRKIVELADEASGLDMQVDGEFRVGRRDTTEEPYVGDLMLRQLAQAYSDHPDYNPEWSTT